ncbi:TetR family transcriptional regulator [Ancylobacter mangrovi]|uniref:TetR family transcriptional regulator n=1 Tax=Ancylobacter mangrovi TaxID=2972472 RepID=UPI0021617E75|nr:TetR family transcriptional regulator [Ancylobacter mangrovi]MCS0503196.1 TetR family transcriptional regulator [Ancylobacter mangrovi]
MADRPKPLISFRKRPRQARSEALVAAILDAAAQVLASEGAARFTTARVAEKAGVSIGSLYQYFPNKAAILFRLQSEEWHQTIELMRTILEDGGTPPLDRLRRLVEAFVRSECDEAPMRGALDDAAPLYRDAPEVEEVMASGDRLFHRFMREALPGVAEATRELAGEVIITTLGAAAKEFSESPRRPAEIAAYAGAMADMFCAYLREIERRPA